MVCVINDQSKPLSENDDDYIKDFYVAISWVKHDTARVGKCFRKKTLLVLNERGNRKTCRKETCMMKEGLIKKKFER